jgi:hypothetical protein
LLVTCVSWIIETKGRVWEGTTAKDEAMEDWCERVSEQTGRTWRYMRVNQIVFDKHKFGSFVTLAAAVLGEGREAILLPVDSVPNQT